MNKITNYLINLTVFSIDTFKIFFGKSLNYYAEIKKYWMTRNGVYMSITINLIR